MNDDSLIFASKGFSEPPRARARFLAQAIQLEEHPPSAVIRSAIYFSVVMLVAGVVWAWATHVNEVTVDYGERGRRAVRELLDRAFAAGLIPRVPRLDFVAG